MTLCSETFLPPVLIFYLSLLLGERPSRMVTHLNKRAVNCSFKPSPLPALSLQVPLMRLSTTISTSFLKKKITINMGLYRIVFESELIPLRHKSILLYKLRNKPVHPLPLCLSSFPHGALEGCPPRSWLLSGEARTLQGLPAWWRRNCRLQQNCDT